MNALKSKILFVKFSGTNLIQAIRRDNFSWNSKNEDVTEHLIELVLKFQLL